MKHHGWWMNYLILMILCFFQVNEARIGDGFIRVDGVRFTLDGVPYYANGFNSYWLMALASDPNQRSKVIEAFAQAHQYGLTLSRIMAYSDGGGAFSLQPTAGQYNENVFQVHNMYFCVSWLCLFPDADCLLLFFFSFSQRD